MLLFIFFRRLLRRMWIRCLDNVKPQFGPIGGLVMHGDSDQCWNPIKRVGYTGARESSPYATRNHSHRRWSRSCPSTENEAAERRKREKNLFSYDSTFSSTNTMLWPRSSVPLIGSERTQNSAVLFLLASKACGEGLRLSFFFSFSSLEPSNRARLLSHVAQGRNGSPNYENNKRPKTDR